MGDINLDLSKSSPPISDYIYMIKSNAFSCIINKPTRVTPTSQTIIAHILTNDTESKVTSNVLL